MTITIALPSKGRMKDDASAIFERAGMKIVAVGNDRSYRGRVENWEDVEVAFLSASEISAKSAAAPSISASPARTSCAKAWLTSTHVSNFQRGSASDMPMSSWPCRRSGTTSTPWPISATSPPTSVPVTAAGSRSRRNTGD